MRIRCLKKAKNNANFKNIGLKTIYKAYIIISRISGDYNENAKNSEKVLPVLQEAY